MSGAPRTTALRLSCFYAALFSAIGLILPFWPVWLHAQDLTAGEIGILLGASYLVKIAVNPLVGHIVDRLGRRRLPMIVLAAATLAAFSAFAIAKGFWALLIVTLVANGIFSALLPIGDNLTLIKTRDEQLDYGRIRLWGSLSFILLAVGGGAALEGGDPQAILLLVLAALGLLLITCVALPEVASSREAHKTGSMLGLLRDPAFLLFLACAGFNQVSHMVYYGFGTLHWRQQGIADFTIGWLWACGVIAEIVLFAFAGPWAVRVGPAILLSIGALAGIVRWIALAITTDVPTLFAVQVLHGATFGCSHLGAMQFILRSSPAGMSARAQAIHSSIAAGLVPGLAMPFMGTLYEALGGYAYLPMAALSLLALIAAASLARVWQGKPLAVHS